MNTAEKITFIHSHLHIANKSMLDQFCDRLQREEVLRMKLESRASKSESDIQSGRLFSRAYIEKGTHNRPL